MLFPELAPESKVWIYTADRVIVPTEQTAIQQELDAFIPEWAAHGEKLYGAATVIHDRFLVLAADQSKVYASGCSLDAATRFIKQIGAKFNIELFNRLYLYVLDEGEFKRVHFTDLASYPEALVFDPTIPTLGRLRSSFPCLLSETSLV